MSSIGRNDKCPCGSEKKYKHCHGNSVELVDLPIDLSIACVCGSGLHPTECCGSFLASPRRMKYSVDKSQFNTDNWYKHEHTGKVFYSVLSTTRNEWNVFRNFYLHGIEVNGRFFKPRTLDVVLEINIDEDSHWTVKCNLDYNTGATLKFQTLLNLKKDKLHIADCNISVTEPLNIIETPYLKINSNRYLRLFHHTSVQGYEGITSTKKVWASPYDLQGSTRELKKVHFAYFTDIPELRYESDLTAVAMREKGRAAFRTDDLSQYNYVDLYENPSAKREKRLIFYIDIQLFAPVPAIFHYQEGSKYIEFFHPHIFRVGINPGEDFLIEEFRDGWKLCKNFIQPNINDIYPIANGNDISDLFKIYQDKYIEP